jgi:hypothetical protein
MRPQGEKGFYPCFVRAACSERPRSIPESCGAWLPLFPWGMPRPVAGTSQLAHLHGSHLAQLPTWLAPHSCVHADPRGYAVVAVVQGERQRPVRYRAITSATVRAGLDKLSKGCGRIEAGEVIVGIECVEFEGTTRIRCSRGWVGQRTRAGKQKLVPVRATCSRYSGGVGTHACA